MMGLIRGGKWTGWVGFGQVETGYGSNIDVSNTDQIVNVLNRVGSNTSQVKLMPFDIGSPR